MSFTIGGRQYSISPDTISTKMEGVSPKGESKYSVIINGMAYPAKQVICVATGLPPVAFTTAYAYRILVKLGYDIIVKI